MKAARTITVAFVCAFMLALAPAALASPAESAYGGECSTPSLCDSSSITSTTTSASSTGSLPFTGINVLELGAMGLMLVGAGFVVRRGRRPTDD